MLLRLYFPELLPFYDFVPYTASQILCAPLLLQFFTDPFETLQGSLLSLEDDPLEFSCCYDYIFRSYCPFMTLYHILRHKSCVHHYSYSFSPILLKLYRVLCYHLRMIPWNFHVATIIFSGVIALL